MRQTLSLIICLLVFTSQGQDRKEADGLFGIGNYEGALELYEEILANSTDDIQLKYRIAVCYLNTNIDKSKAIEYLEAVVDNEEVSPNARYLLGRAYHYGYQFEKAIDAYNKFVEKGEGAEDNLLSVPVQIEYCENALELMKYPLSVDIENLGSNVNSPYPDYFPFVPKDESFLLFNSRRQNGESLPDGHYTADLYMSKVKDGKFQKATRLGDGINTNEGNEEVVGLTADGSKAVVYLEKADGTGDLHVCEVKDMVLGEPQKLDKMINSRYTEIAASMTRDGSAIYFASDKPDGEGGTDLYVSRKLPNGKWSPAQNLGPHINTEQDEDFPNISPDGQILYFSSRGHTSMGGYDIFKAHWDVAKKRFGSVENMRFPINTPEDDMNFMVSQTGRYGYMSSLRSDGYGDLDIYRVTFNTVEPRYSVITGHLKASDGEFGPDDVFMAVIDMETDEVYGDYKPNPNTMRYVMILPPGKFEINLEIDGFQTYIEEIQVLDKASFKSFINKDIVVDKQ